MLCFGRKSNLVLTFQHMYTILGRVSKSVVVLIVLIALHFGVYFFSVSNHSLAQIVGSAIFLTVTACVGTIGNILIFYAVISQRVSKAIRTDFRTLFEYHIQQVGLQKLLSLGLTSFFKGCRFCCWSLKQLASYIGTWIYCIFYLYQGHDHIHCPTLNGIKNW